MEFVIEQKFALVTNAYRIYHAENDGIKKSLFAYVQQKRLAMREKITFYKDDAMDEILFTLRAEKRIDLHGKYIIEDNTGNELGYLKREFKASLLRSTWRMYDPNNAELFLAHERSQALALLRRAGDFIPYVGFIFNLLPYHFDFIKSEHVVGSFSRKVSLRDKYVLKYRGDDRIDERAIVALGVALDVLQSR